MMARSWGGLGVVLTALLVWGVTSAQGATTSSSQDPAQLSTAAALFVKVDPKTGTDTIIVVNRQQAGSATSPGSAITIHVRFYDRNCNVRFDNNVSVTPQGIFVALASSLFGISEPGVVLADFADADFHNPCTSCKFALSGVVIDGNFDAIYERQGSPLLQPIPPGAFIGRSDAEDPIPTWGGFSDQSIDDWFIGGFTMVQMICPGGSELLPGGDGSELFLGDDMNALADVGDLCVSSGEEDPCIDTELLWANSFPVVNVYDAKEVLKRSIHNVFCSCNSDSAFFGDFADIISSMKAVGLGTFHWDNPTRLEEDGEPRPGMLIGWRVISSGGAAPIYWSAALRHTSPPPVGD